MAGICKLLGSSTGQLSQRGLTVGQLTDSVSIVRGKHTIKTGIDLRVQLRNNFQPGAGVRAVRVHARDERQSAGHDRQHRLRPRDVSARRGEPWQPQLVAVACGRVRYYGAFVQDDYRIAPRLTLNLGLRYDVITAPTDRFDRYSNFNPTDVNPVTGTPGVLQYAGVDFGRQAYDTNYDNFGPRAGFAWDIFGDGRTVVRGRIRHLLLSQRRLRVSRHAGLFRRHAISIGAGDGLPRFPAVRRSTADYPAVRATRWGRAASSATT